MKRLTIIPFLLLIGAQVGCTTTILINGHVYYVEEFFTDKKAIELTSAAVEGDIPKVEKLVAEGVNIDSRGKDGITPLYLALIAKNYEGFEKLLQLGAEPNIDLPKGPDILYVCLAYPDSRFLKAALKYGADPNKEYSSSYYLLTYAALIDFPIDNIKMLLDGGANPDIALDIIQNPFLTAIQTRHYRTAQLLLEYGSKALENDTIRKEAIDAIEKSAQFEGSKELAERTELVKYLEEVKGLKLKLLHPEGTKRR